MDERMTSVTLSAGVHPAMTCQLYRFELPMPPAAARALKVVPVGTLAETCCLLHNRSCETREDSERTVVDRDCREAEAPATVSVLKAEDGREDDWSKQERQRHQ